MASFVVIGANDDVKCVVDGILESHLRHNNITSGCVEKQGNDLYYNWKSYSKDGKSDSSADNPIKLRDALTNQIAHFKNLLPSGTRPNIFIVSRCHTAEHAERLGYVCTELKAILGKVLEGVSVDIVLLGYDLGMPNDVAETVRPHWTVLKERKDIWNIFNYDNILYLNNMDYKGRATTIDAKLLSKFLGYWAKVVNTGSGSPKITIGTAKFYSIGMAEYQYDFEDIAEYFKLEADVRIINRRLDANPPMSAVMDMLHSDWYKDIDLSRPWIDGLRYIESSWKVYCDTEYDYSNELDNHPYCLQKQIKAIALYLNCYLKRYVSKLQEELDGKQDSLDAIENKIKEQESEKDTVEAMVDPDDDNDPNKDELSRLNKELSESNKEKKNTEKEISELEAKIEEYSFYDVNDIYSDFNPSRAITQRQCTESEKAIASENELERFLITDEAVEILLDIEKDLSEEERAQIGKLSSEIKDNVGRRSPYISASAQFTVQPPISSASIVATQEEKKGCLVWFKGLFGKKAETTVAEVTTDAEIETPSTSDDRANWNDINDEKKELKSHLDLSVKYGNIDWSVEINKCYSRFLWFIFIDEYRVKEFKCLVRQVIEESREFVCKEKVQSFYQSAMSYIDTLITSISTLMNGLDKCIQTCTSMIGICYTKIWKFQYVLHEDDMKNVVPISAEELIERFKKSQIKVSGWLGEADDSVYNQILAFVSNMPEIQKIGEKDIESKIKGMTDAELSVAIDKLKEMASPLWNVNLDPNVTLSEKHICGSKNMFMSDSRFSNYLSKDTNVTFADTQSDNSVVFYTFEYQSPIYTVSNTQDYREYATDNSLFPCYIDENWHKRMEGEKFDYAPPKPADVKLSMWVQSFVFDLIKFDEERSQYYVVSDVIGDSHNDNRYELGESLLTAFDKFNADNALQDVLKNELVNMGVEVTDHIEKTDLESYSVKINNIKERNLEDTRLPNTNNNHINEEVSEREDEVSSPKYEYDPSNVMNQIEMLKHFNANRRKNSFLHGIKLGCVDLGEGFWFMPFEE